MPTVLSRRTQKIGEDLLRAMRSPLTLEQLEVERELDRLAEGRFVEGIPPPRWAETEPLSRIPGMERIGELPGPGLPPPLPEHRILLHRIAQQITPAPHILTATTGARKFVTGEGPGGRLRGASEAIEGVIGAGAGLALPFLPQAIAAAPVATLVGFPAIVAAAKGAEWIMEALGADPDVARLVGNIALFVGPALAIPGAKVARTQRLNQIYSKISEVEPLVAESQTARIQLQALTNAARQIEAGGAPTLAAPAVASQASPFKIPEAETRLTLPRPRWEVAPTAPPKQTVDLLLPTEEWQVMPSAAATGKMETPIALGPPFVPAPQPRAPMREPMFPDLPKYDTVVRPTPWQKKMVPEAGKLVIPVADIEQARLKWLNDYFDEFTPTRELAKRAPLAFGENPYIAHRMYAGHYGKIWMGHRELRSILQPVASWGRLKEFRRLMVAERDVELFQRSDIGAGYKTPHASSLTDAQLQLDGLRTQLGTDLAPLGAKIADLRSFYDRKLQGYRDSGMLEEKAYQKIKENNQYYVPFQRLSRFAGNPDAVPVGWRSFDVRKQDVVYPIKGGEEEIADVLESTLRNLHKMISAGERNLVGRKIADLSRRPEWAETIRRRKFNEEVGPKGGKRKVKEELGPDELTFTVFEDGVKGEYVAPKLVVESMRGMGPRDLRTWEKWIAATNAGIRAGATAYYLPFVVKNLFRDYMTATLRSPFGFSPIDMAKGLATTLGRNADFERYMLSGAPQAGFFERDPTLSATLGHITESNAKRIIRHAINPVTLVRLLSETSELSTRVGMFERALSQGMSEPEAAFLARNITVDFSRSGTRMKIMNNLIPFLNARVQGTANIFASIRGNPKRTAAIAILGAGFPSVATTVHNLAFHPETYNKIPGWVKDNSYLVIYGDGVNDEGKPNQYVTWPKADWQRWFGNPNENFVENLYNNNPRSFWGVALDTMSDVSPIGFSREGEFSPGRLAGEITPPVVAAPFELWVGNKSAYTGHPIIPPYWNDPSAPFSQRWGPEFENSLVGKTMIRAGQFLHMSPYQIQHLAGRFGGGVGRSITSFGEPEVTGAKTLMEKLAKYSDAIARQSGTANAWRMFAGEMGGGEEERLIRDLHPHEEKASIEKLVRKRDVERLLQRVSKLKTPEERVERITEMVDADPSLDPEVALEAIDRAALEATGLTSGYRHVYYINTPRAKGLYLHSMMQKLSPEKFDKLLEGWEEKGFLTDAVMDALADAEAEAEAEPTAPTGTVGQPPQRGALPKPRVPQPASVADRNNNPGNIRQADGLFSKFDRPETGWQALHDDLELKIQGRSRYLKPDNTLLDLFNTWAPAIEPPNDPDAYTDYVATRLNLKPSTKLKDLQGREWDLARVMGEYEGWNGPPPAALQPRFTISPSGDDPLKLFGGQR